MALSNNDVFKKLRVALKLRAIFRSEDHPKYVECGDQFLRNFLNGLVIHMRGPMPPKKAKTTDSSKKSTPNKRSPKKD